MIGNKIYKLASIILRHLQRTQSRLSQLKISKHRSKNIVRINSLLLKKLINIIMEDHKNTPNQYPY